VQQLWRAYGANQDRDKFTYGYDPAGNRLYRQHALASPKDEHYTYDGVNQLIISKQGTLNTGKTDIDGTPLREEDFTLDSTGNWTGYIQKTSGTATLSQSRTYNVANELTAASSWATPAHDRAGNMTTVPKPSSLANGLALKYDAWNRLVQVTDGSTAVAKYEYLCPCQLARACFFGWCGFAGPFLLSETTEKGLAGGAGGGNERPCSTAGGGRKPLQEACCAWRRRKFVLSA
jgi:hypothetical protein